MSTDPIIPMTVGIETLAQRVNEIHEADPGLVIGLTGSVASGKSTLAHHLEQSLEPELSVETVSTEEITTTETTSEFPTKAYCEVGSFT